MTSAPVTGPLKWHGGKYYLASRIIELMPKHLHYVEPFAGGLAVLLSKDPDGISEVANDLNGGLTNFWRVLQNEETFAKFQRRMEAMPFSQQEWRDAKESLDAKDPLERAVAFFVRCRQSLSGRMTGFAPITRNRTRRRMNEQASAWMGAVEGLRAVHERLRRVVILNDDALRVIKGQDGPNTLFYLDPPYMHATRTTTHEYGEQEMGDKAHEKLIKLLVQCQGKVMLSNYSNPLYHTLSEKHGWRMTTFDLPNNAAAGGSKMRMTECLWMNFK